MLFRGFSLLSCQSIRPYLSAVRHVQIMSGLPDPSLSSFARCSPGGTYRAHTTRPRSRRLPITQGWNSPADPLSVVKGHL